MQRIFGASSREEESEWLSVSDLMAGLMVIFLFIAIIFIRPLAEENRELVDLQRDLEEKTEQLEQQNLRMSEVAVTWQDREQRIYEALLQEFQDDLPRWNAEIEQATLLIRFNSPDVLFESGADAIRTEFAEILSDFYPRYVATLTPFREALEELRIEGHTSSEWTNASPEQAYIENMRLSQDRTRAVLEFVLGQAAVASDRSWLQSLVTANGLSSSRLVLTPEGFEDPERSRRVEFRVRTTARTEIARILEAAQ